MYKKTTTTIVEEHYSKLPSMYSEENIIKVNIPLMIRLLEYAREDASSDVDLHLVVEKMTEMCEEGTVLEMKDYAEIIGC